MVPLAGTLVGVLICTEELFAAGGQAKVRLGVVAPAADWVVADKGAQDPTDTADASAVGKGLGAVQLRPARLHNSGEERMEKEVRQMYRHTGLRDGTSSVDACFGILLTKTSMEGDIPAGGWPYI